MKLFTRLYFYSFFTLTFANPAFSNDVIRPGACVGQVCIGQSRDEVRQILGKPSVIFPLRPSRLGHDVDLWMGSSNRGSHFLFVAYSKGAVLEIHASSPRFQTEERLSTACSFQDVEHFYSQGKGDEYSLLSNGKNRFDWTEKDQGITFSFAGDRSGPMLLIVIHKPGRRKTIGYSKDDWYWYPKRQGQYVAFKRHEQHACQALKPYLNTPPPAQSL